MALYLQNYIQEQGLATVEIADLLEYDFPVFHERLQHTPKPSEQALDFQKKVLAADGVIIVTPEYNGGYPAALKNAFDLLVREWRRKPIAIATVSDGSFGGAQVTTSLLFTLWKIGAWVVPAMFPTPSVQDQYNEEGHPHDREASDKRARRFIGELLWCMEARQRMEPS